MSDEIEKTETFEPTKPAAWNQGPYEVELPSGNKVLAYRPKVFLWHKRGQIPADVWATMVAVAEDEKTSIEARWEAINWQICKCAVKPEISLTPRDGALCMDDIDDVDRQAMMFELGIGV